jgi:hypothetical protein
MLALRVISLYALSVSLSLSVSLLTLFLVLPPTYCTLLDDERKKQIQERRAKREAARAKRDSGMGAAPGKSVLSIFGGSKDKSSAATVDESVKSSLDAVGNKIASLERENVKLRSEFDAYKSENEKVGTGTGTAQEYLYLSLSLFELCLPLSLSEPLSKCLTTALTARVPLAELLGSRRSS